MMTNLKYVLYGIIAIFVLYSWFGDSSEGEVQYEEVELPTQGLATILQETEPDLFKIEDEQALPTVEESIIVAKYLDGQIDTFTLAEVRLMEQSTSSPRHSSIARAASIGFFGYMMGRSMSTPVRAGAYMDQKTYNRVNSSTGSQVRNTASRTTRAKPSSGKSGYGGGKSTRSYGG